MNTLARQLEKAARGGFRLWLLNAGLLRTVPFNRPHGIKVTDIGQNSLVVRAKNVRSNRNHIKGIHACLLATLCEYVCGLSLLRRLDPKEYRIILKQIGMTYHYQAKQAVQAAFSIDDIYFETEIRLPLEREEAIFREFAVEVHDEAGNHICTGLIRWQIKSWKKVKTL